MSRQEGNCRMSRTLPVLGILFLASGLHGLGIDHIGLEGAYRFDPLATHGLESRLRCDVELSSAMKLGATVEYLDATQDHFHGVKRLRGRIVSGLLGLEWRGLRNRLTVDAQAGVDGVLDWELKPRGSLRLRMTAPLPPNRFVQNLKLTPEIWYTHSMFNGPAIKNRIASYGYAGELSWSMGPKMAAAVSLRREHLRPSDPVLDTAFTDLSLQRGAPVDTLKPNTLSTFYAYIYRRLTTFFYLGYAFSRLDAAFDGVALTDAQGPIPPLPQYETTFAMYPYPTLNELISHTASITLLFNPVSSITWTSKASVPFYSAQKVYAFPDTLMTHHFDDQDEVKYGYKLEFAAPLTIGTTVDYNVRNNLTVSFTYDCFGFPYEEWAYFTKNSYSLHTFKLRITQRL